MDEAGENPDTKQQTQSDPGMRQRTHSGCGVIDQRVKAWSENRAHVYTTMLAETGAVRMDQRFVRIKFHGSLCERSSGVRRERWYEAS